MNFLIRSFFKGGGDEAGKEGVWVVGLGEEFWVELSADVERMIGKFDDFY